MPGARRRGRPRTAWMDNIKTWTRLSVKSQSEWRKTEINGESTSTVWPTLGSRTAKEQNSFSPVIMLLSSSFMSSLVLMMLFLVTNFNYIGPYCALHKGVCVMAKCIKRLWMFSVKELHKLLDTVLFLCCVVSSRVLGCAGSCVVFSFFCCFLFLVCYCLRAVNKGLD